MQTKKQDLTNKIKHFIEEYLEETEGRFICDKCGNEIEIPQFKKPKRIPIYDSRTLVAALNNR